MIGHPVLEGLGQYGIRLGLDRIRGMLGELGDPHLAPATIHVAGTNGKGSVVRIVSSILQQTGLRVGELSSPHLQQVNERIRVQGESISDEALDGLLWELDRERRRWAEGDEDSSRVLTYFEMMTTAGFLHLARQQVDVAVVEVGMGGRLDATNVAEPLLTAITTVDLDHTDQLGPDVPCIAAEKAGIVKPDRPLVTGRLDNAALRVVRAIAQERGAPVVEFDRDYRVHLEQGGTLTWSSADSGTLRGLRVALMGGHQIDNAGVAIALVKRLPPGLVPDDDAIRRGLESVTHAGRLEWLAPDVLVDCAHNPAGAIRLAAALRELPRDGPRTLLFGMSGDKDARTVAVTLAPHVDRLLTTRCSHPRALPAGDLAAALVGVDLPVLPAGPVEAALPLARDGRSLVVVAGSVFLVGAVRDLLGVR